MAGIESIDKLLSRLRDMDADNLVAEGNGLYKPDVRHHLIADEIEREIENEYVPRMAFRALQLEISEHYMELPVSADGEVIRIGDKLEDGETCFTVEGFISALPNGMGNPTPCDIDKCLHMPQSCHHVNPRTIEDVLEDFGIACDEQYPIRPRTELIAEYANEIRGLL